MYRFAIIDLTFTDRFGRVWPTGYRVKVIGPKGEVIRFQDFGNLSEANHAIEEAMDYLESQQKQGHLQEPVIPGDLLKMPGWR